ncbi:centromere protein scm3 domain-containing protein [Trichoderma breve]|uniref:Centromere protein scm3 domain-containing protein n=1 Tax=Trichoderma breve TaxID=2034170 RepID=A0A9W9EAC9_9HYPO|nr:centromere protein scm3 domain-containing protein [Trichoderma breve]KAJ4862911.1 centromere protein scm3 domain-containing protein [Trichoderma breve]
MEPPAKRRRMSQWLLDKENADEDDELASQPFEVEAKRDPDYKLSVERAYADQRFQITMAHIFEKYGRDFDGIGDEIDLVTGEIVVNNGHVRNMRDEGDVGDGLAGDLADGEDDEDEGILLEDLFDDEEEDGDENINDMDDDEEDRIIQGREASRDSHSTALVLGSSSRNTLDVSRAVARSSLYAAKGFASPTELPFASSPFSFDRSPFATEPWGFPGHFADPLWDQPELFAVHQPQKQQLPIKPSRYNFPSQSGESSIWAPNSKFRDNEDEPLQSAFTNTFGKHLLTRRKKIIRHPLLLPPTKPVDDESRRGEEEEEEDEDVILTGKRYKEKQTTDDTSAEPARQSSNLQPSKSLARKEAEERGGEGTSSDSGYKSVGSARRSRKRKQRSGEDLTRNEASATPSESLKRASNPQPNELSHKVKEPDLKASLIELPDETDGRRRSGRTRKQVEFLNKISWAEALAERSAEKHDLYPKHGEAEGPESTPEYEEHRTLSEPETDCIPDSADEEEEEEEGGEGEDGDANPQIDLPIPHESEARQPEIANQSRAQVPAGFLRKPVDSGCILSDDEAPTLLSKPRKSAPRRISTSTLPLREIHDVEANSRAEANSSDVGKERLSGYSLKKRMSTKNAIINSSPTAHKGGIGRLDIPSEESSGEAPSSSSPTRFLSRNTLEVSLDDTPQTLETSAKKKRRRSKPVKHIAAVTVIDDSSYETFDDLSHTESSPLAKASLRVEPALPSPRRTISPPEEVNQALAQSPSKGPSNSPSKSPSKGASNAPSKSPTKSPSKRDSQLASSMEVDRPLPSLNNPPQTPRRHRSLKVPSSRHSILSLLSDDEDEGIDELGRNLTAVPKLLSSATQTTARKVWKSSTLTREVYHTPVKKRPSEPVSPGSIIKTPGGTLRACGLDGYRCGRDFCFTCL